ncbi:amino acid adenylation domain-containing protein [Nocardia sp. BMG111209]|uniref:amino acid adenylation domain-containing protein n=1 Tax=Nocardia sp. BMG111209 TaxID=1160137 RepID=UPI00350F1684
MSHDGTEATDRAALRRELLRRRMAESGLAAADSATSAPRRRHTGDRLPLSAGQRRLWFLQTRDPDDTTLNICVAYRLTGPVEADRLRAAIDTVVDRHEILRTTYGLGDDGTPYQIVRDRLPVDWSTHDLSGLADTSRDRRLEVLTRREFGRPFDLAAQSPLRIALIDMGVRESGGQREFALVLVVHHICWDDDSWAVFFAELNAAYRGDEILAPGTQFADIETAEPEAAGLDYWRRTLRPLPEALELPGRPAAEARQADRRRIALPAALTGRVQTFARDHAATPFMVLLAAFQAVVNRYTATADFLISVPVTVRRTAAAEALIGYFGNTLLVRADVAAEASFTTLVDRVRETSLGAFAHQDVGIDHVVREANPDRHSGRDGLQQLVRLGFSVRKSAVGFDLPDVTAAQLEFGSPVAQVSLGLMVVLDDAGATVEAEYLVGELDSAVVDQLLGHYVRFLDSALTEPTVRLRDLDMLGADDRATILARAQGPVVAAPDTTLVALFENRVAAEPDSLAVVAPRPDGPDLHLTYRDLDRRANRLAHRLIRGGIGTEDIVGLRLSNSVEFVVGLLAVLKSGAGYLPIDPAYPADRIDYLVADAHPALVLDGGEFAAAEAASAGLPDTAPTDADRLRPLRPGNLAYVIYTSGSTGRPKGVPVPHHAIAEHLEGFTAEWGMTAADRLLQSSSVSFDASLLDIYVTFTVGACLVIPKPDAFRDIPYVAEVITRCGVTVLHMVPSMLSTFLLLPEVSTWRALRHVPVGGEALPGEVADRFAGIFDAELRNHYGPTEAVVCATHMPVEGPQGTGIVPIGVPNRNVFACLLDAALHPVPDGVVGEIYLGGEQLARGYLNRPGLSAERFVADPFHAGARLYRTGDLARRNATGAIEFVGRADEQVKVRGFRIELGEVEAAIGSHPAVGHCVVIAVADAAVGAMLAAYVVPAAGWVPDIGEVRAHAAATLPDYMVPAAFAVIDEIPLTVHGKLDRRALPQPQRADTRRYREPASATEIRLAALYGEIFGRERIGADDSFFELGGHSLLATRLIVLIRNEFGVQLDVRAPFDHPTVAGLAAVLETAPAATAPARPALVKRAHPDRIPLTSSQLALWFERKLEGPSAIGNIAFAVRLDGALDLGLLTAALGDVVARHDALRTVFGEADGVPYQTALPAGPIPLPVTALDDPQRLRAELAAAGQHCFELSGTPLLRPRIFRLDTETHVLSLLVHHLIADHASFRTILTDLAAAYRARAAGQAPDWSPLPVDYADYALWQRDTAADSGADLDYWRTRLAGLPAELTAGADHPRPAVLGKNGHVVPFTVPAALRQRLRTLAETAGASEFMLYQAAVVALLHGLGAGVDIPLGTPVAGRDDPAAADLVGLLANMVVLRNDLSGDPTLRTVLDRARSAALTAYGHQHVPLERVVEAVNPPRSRSRNPLFQAMMHFREEDWTSAGIGFGSAAATVLPLDFDVSLLDLSINFFAGAGGGFDASVIVNTDLYLPITGELLAQRMLGVLRDFAEDLDRPLHELEVFTPGERERLTGEWADGVRLADHPDPAEILRGASDLPPERIAVRCGDETLTYAALFAAPAAADVAAAAPADVAAAADVAAEVEIAAEIGEVATAAGIAALLAALNRTADDGRPLMLTGDTAESMSYDRNALAAAVADRRAVAAERSPAAEFRGIADDVRLIAAPWPSAEIAVELLAAVADGATLVVATEAEREDPAALVELIGTLGVTHVVADTAIPARFVHTGISVLPSVLRWDLHGTSWPAALPDLLPALSADSIATFGYLVPGYAGPVARGPLADLRCARPTSGARVVILDDRLRPVPVGVPGDIHIGGSALAADDSPALSGRLIADPFRADGLLLRTGDRGRRTADGALVPGTEATAETVAAVRREPGDDTGTEARLSALLAELLELDDDTVTTDDNFFALGGDSVISLQWSVRAAEAGLPLTPQMVFEYMTIGELAVAVDEALAAGEQPDLTNLADPAADPAPAAEPAPEHSPMSLSGLDAGALSALGAAWKASR